MMKFTRSTETQPSQPDAARPRTLAEASPRWAALMAKLHQLVAREDEALAELLPLTQKIGRENGYATWNEWRVTLPAPPTQGPTQVDRALEKLDGLIEAPPPQPPPPLPEHPLRARADELSREIYDIRAAVAMLHPEIDRAAIEGSEVLARARKDEYTAIVRRAAQAMIDLGNAKLEHDAFIASLGPSTVRMSFFKMVQFPELSGWSSDLVGGLRQLVSWPVECGHVDPAMIPEAWKKQ